MFSKTKIYSFDDQNQNDLRLNTAKRENRCVETLFYNLSLAVAKSYQRKPFPLLTTENLLDIKSYTQQFFQDLYSRLKTPSMVVLDNLQEVFPARNFHQLLCDGLSVIPEGITVVLIGRNTFPQTLVSLRSNVTFIGWDKLRLTHAKSKELTRFLGHKDISSEMILQLYEITEGWMSGLILMLEIARQERPFSISIADPIPEEIIDYFNTNIFQITTSLGQRDPFGHWINCVIRITRCSMGIYIVPFLNYDSDFMYCFTI